MALVDWMDGPLGEFLLRTEQDLLTEQLQNIYGYHLLQIGDYLPFEVQDASPITHQVSFNALDLGRGVHVKGDLDHLPFASSSIDLVVLPHTLETVAKPNHILNEVYRVLIPEGHVFITGFNPFSTWGIKELFQNRRRSSKYEGAFIARWRLQNWLSFLDCEILSSSYFLHRPPVTNQKILQKLALLDRLGGYFKSFMGGAYYILAQKQVSTMTPVKLKKHRLRRKQVLKTVPSARGMHSD